MENTETQRSVHIPPKIFKLDQRLLTYKVQEMDQIETKKSHSCKGFWRYCVFQRTHSLVCEHTSELTFEVTCSFGFSYSQHILVSRLTAIHLSELWWQKNNWPNLFNSLYIPVKGFIPQRRKIIFEMESKIDWKRFLKILKNLYHLRSNVQHFPGVFCHCFPAKGAEGSGNAPVPGWNKSLANRDFGSNNPLSGNACPWRVPVRFIAELPLTIIEAFKGHSL